MDIIIVNESNPFVSRALKLAALRHGHNRVPDNWVDCILAYNGRYHGITFYDDMNESKIHHLIQEGNGEPSFFTQRDTVFFGLDFVYNDDDGNIIMATCKIFGEVIFVAKIQEGASFNT